VSAKKEREREKRIEQIMRIESSLTASLSSDTKFVFFKY